MKLSVSDRTLHVVIHGFLIALSVSCLFPVLHVFSLSFSSTHAAASGLVAVWPVGFTLESFRLLFLGTRAGSGFLNSVLITVAGVGWCVAFTILAAYPLSKRFFYFRRFFTLAIVFTMLFRGGLIPNYLLVKSLGLLNTYWALWLPALVSVYNMMITKTYFEKISEEVEEAARIDGSGEWRLLFQIVLPVSLPVLAVITLFYGVGFWNAFMNVLIYITETKKQNLTIIIQQMIQSQNLLNEMNIVDEQSKTQVVEETLKAAGVVTLITPMLVVYPFLQKYFVKGVMLGSVKG